MKSFKVRVALCWSLKMLTFANNHNNALFHLVGNILNCGRNIHSSGIQNGIVRSISAIRVFAYCHILLPAPHAISQCSSVSSEVHLWQEIEGVIFIRCSRAFVVIRSCTAWYDVRLVLSDIEAFFMFFHIGVQLVLGHRFCIRFPGELAAARIFLILKHPVYKM